MQTKGLVDGLKEKNLEEKRSKQLLELELNVSWAGQSVVMSLLCMSFCLSVRSSVGDSESDITL